MLHEKDPHNSLSLCLIQDKFREELLPPKLNTTIKKDMIKTCFFLLLTKISTLSPKVFEDTTAILQSKIILSIAIWVLYNPSTTNLWFYPPNNHRPIDKNLFKRIDDRKMFIFTEHKHSWAKVIVLLSI